MTAADWHRPNGRCIDPQRLGLRLRWIPGRARNTGNAAWCIPQGGPAGFRGGNGQGFQPGNTHQAASRRARDANRKKNSQ